MIAVPSIGHDALAEDPLGGLRLAIGLVGEEAFEVRLVVQDGLLAG